MPNLITDIKAGDMFVREIHGGGMVTESLIEIEEVINDIAYVEGADGDYEADSVYAHSLKNARSINNYTPGFFSKLSRKATAEDIERLRED